MPLGGSSDGGAANLEAQRQADITQGTDQVNQQFAGFTPDFYQQAATDYTNATTPEMMADYRNTKNNLTYALSRGGLLKSGAAVQRNASLSNQLSQNESQITNQAQQKSDQLQADVANQKGQLISQVQSGAEPSAIAAQAAGSASQLRVPSVVQPLGNLFSDWSNQYLNNVYANSSANSGGGGSSSNVWNNLANSGVGTVNGTGGSSYMVQ